MIVLQLPEFPNASHFLWVGTQGKAEGLADLAEDNRFIFSVFCREQPLWQKTAILPEFCSFWLLCCFYFVS